MRALAQAQGPLSRRDEMFFHFSRRSICITLNDQFENRHMLFSSAPIGKAAQPEDQSRQFQFSEHAVEQLGDERVVHCLDKHPVHFVIKSGERTDLVDVQIGRDNRRAFSGLGPFKQVCQQVLFDDGVEQPHCFWLDQKPQLKKCH